MAPRLLVVDDEPNNLDLVERILGTEFELDCFEDPLQALQALEERDYDLILTDQRMPKLTGVELLTRAARVQAHVRRVVLSAFTDSNDLLPAINDGRIHRYLTKPIQPSALRRCVRALTAGMAGGTGRWLVVDTERQRGEQLVDVLAEIDPHATVSLQSTVDVTPDVTLILLVEPSLEAIGSLVHELGGPSSRVSILVASGAGGSISDAAYLQAGAADVASLPVSPVELALRIQTQSLRHLTNGPTPRRSSNRQPEAVARTALVQLLAEDLLRTGQGLPSLIEELQVAVVAEARRRFGADLDAAAKHINVPADQLRRRWG